MYEAITELEGGSSALANAGQWMEIPPKAYFHPKDSVLLSKDIFTYIIPDADITEVEISLDRFGDNKNIVAETINTGLVLEKVEVPMRPYPAGKYLFNIKYTTTSAVNVDETIELYWEAGIALEKPFALVHLAQHEASQLDDYQLLAPGVVEHPDKPGTNIKVLRDQEVLRKFEINFKNRSTYWFYTFSKQQQPAWLADFEPVDSNNTKFVYKTIQQLTRFPVEVKKTLDRQLVCPKPLK
ncbi:MAG: hypothetical protein HC896_07665, partial [Bacteroidales bacterium]|nr:hypothetical protein [Bacteroidales bacterium]